MEYDYQEAYRLFEVKKNSLKMMKRRGYDISREQSLLGINLTQFLDAYIPHAKKENKSLRGVLTNVYVRFNKNKNKEERILVYFSDVSPDASKMGVSEINEAIADMDKYKLKNAVLITPLDPSPSAKKNIQGLVSYNIQVFNDAEMAYDPIEHIFVPEHIPLTDEEQRLFLEKSNIEIDQLPAILDSDIIVRYYGLRPGRVVKIIRTNLYETMITKSESYRVVKETV